MKSSVPAALLLTLALFTGCKSSTVDNASAIQSLKDNETQWNADFASKDAAKIGAHYADDATLIVAGEKPTSGKEAIMAEFKQMAADPAFSLQIHTDKAVVSSAGDFGYTEGTYNLTITKPADKAVIHDSGTYVTVYRKAADGTWKAVSDAPVSSVPPSAPQPKQ